MNPNQNRKRGKRIERDLAKRLGGKRVGILGKTDISHAVFSFEVKGRVKFVAEKWFQQAVRNCEEGKIPAVIVHVTGQHHGNDYVIMQLKDFEDWLGRVEKC